MLIQPAWPFFLAYTSLIANLLARLHILKHFRQLFLINILSPASNGHNNPYHLRRLCW